jgi:hypothetical protein
MSVQYSSRVDTNANLKILASYVREGHRQCVWWDILSPICLLNVQETCMISGSINELR